MSVLNYDIFVFDFDGTIAQSGIGITTSVGYALEKMGKPDPGMETLLKFIGPPLFTAFVEYCGLNEQEAEEAVAHYREFYGNGGLLLADIYPGVTPLLKALKKKGKKVVVASGKPVKFLRRIIDHFGLTDLIDAIAGPDLGNHSSDKTAQVLEVLEGADPKTACMVGDRKFDIQAGKNLGMHTVGVAYGYGTAEELEAEGADFVAMTVRDLQQHLLEEGDLPKGKMITFEGTDGCGKSTQIKKLTEYLTSRGYEVHNTREPGGCPISEKIRDVLLSLECKGMSDECEALMYAASRIEHVKSVILPALKDGKIVLCDRFLDSSIAYQAYGRELGEDFIRLINQKATDLVTPDCTLQFDIDREAAKARMAQGAPLDRLEIEKEDFFTRVAQGYNRVAEQDPDRIHRIDSGRTIEEVFEDVMNVVVPMIGKM